MARSRPLTDPMLERKRLTVARHRRSRRWEVDTPNGTSFRQIRRAFAFGYSPSVVVKSPEKYLSAHQRRMNALIGALKARG